MKKIFILLLLLFRFASMHPALGETESIMALSDTHLTKQTRDHADMLQAVMQAAQGKDLVLLTGDNTDNAHTEEHAMVLEWAGMMEQQTGAEVYIIPGNHDYGAFFGPDQFISLYGAYGWDRAFSRDSGTASCAVMTRKGTCLLMLDTNRPDTDRSFLPDGSIGEETLRWVQEVLEALRDGTPVIACGHHPILPEERNERTPGASALSRLLRAYGAGLYLCGHDHGFATAEAEGLRQITLGQPQAYPGWVGIIEKEDGTFYWHTEQIYGDESPAFLRLRENAVNLSRAMARGTLESTPYAGDEDAIEWFSAVFMLSADGRMTPEDRIHLLADENCGKWRRVETRTVVKDWILSLLENRTEGMREFSLPPSRKHPAEQLP